MNNKQIHCILEGGPPIIPLGNTILVGFSKGGIVIELEILEFQSHEKRAGRTAVTARLNWLIGCNVGGHRSRISSTNSGIAARAAQSWDRPVTCSCVGTSPVIRSQKRPSGKGSKPPGALGRSSWHSGIDLPRKRIPSSIMYYISGKN